MEALRGGRFWLFFALATLIWFSLIGTRDLFDPDEGRYAEIPREMIAGDDWLTPRLMGLKYFEKPPMQYWQTAAAYSVFGVSASAARLWPMLAGLLGVIWTGYLAARLYNRQTGYYAAAITMSSMLYFGAAHYLTLDMSLSFFLMIAVGSFALAQSSRSDPRACRNWMLLGWAALAGATLSKGLVGIVLPAGAVALHTLWARDWSIWRHMHLGKGALLLLALTAPWFVQVSLANDEFFEFFFIHEHFQRFTTTEHGREGPLYYFIPVLALGLFPWLVTVLRGLVGVSWRNTRRASDGAFGSTHFFLLFSLVVFLFFSLSGSKLPLYVVPILPFLAIMGGRRLARAGCSRVDGWMMIAFAAAIAAASPFIDRFATETVPLDMIEGLARWVLAAAIVWLVSGLLVLYAPLRRDTKVAGVALLALIALQLTLWGVQALAPSRSAAAVAQLIDRSGVPVDAPVYLVGLASPSLAFYLQRVPVIVDYRGEMTMGQEAEPGKSLRGPDAMAAAWSATSSAVAVVKSRLYSRYAGIFGEDVQICKDTRRTVVFKGRQSLGSEGCGDFERVVSQQDKS